MNNEILYALSVFAFVSSITPGPNNLMLMNSGTNFGFRKTLPHLLGVGIGFTLMIVLVGLGIMKVFDVYPLSYQMLKFSSVAYLLFLAYKIATSSSASNVENKAKPMTFLQAALFQWVNPKAWTMALTAISIYAPSKDFSAVLIVAIIFGLINLPCIGSWVTLGQKIKLLLKNEICLRAFNVTMALLLVVSVLPTIFPT